MSGFSKIKKRLAAMMFGMLALTGGAFAQDVMQIGNGSSCIAVPAGVSSVNVPIYIRDVSGTPLDVNKPAGQTIQAIAFQVIVSPASAVAVDGGGRLNVTVNRAGITASLSPLSEAKPRTSATFGYLVSFDEFGSPIPFNLNAPAPGDQVASVNIPIAAGVAPGTVISLNFDPNGAVTNLYNQGGTIGETVAAGTLRLVNGCIRYSAVPTVQFSAATYSVNEGAGTAAITVTRTGDTSAASSVTFTTSDGTATAGSDYTAVTTTVNFSSGQTSQTVNVPILEDPAIEGNETVNLTLSGASGSALGIQSTALLTIVDNDFPPPTVTSVACPSGLTVGGGSRNGTITISAPAPTGGAMVTLSSGSPGVASVPPSVTVPAGSTTVSFRVTPLSAGTAVITATLNSSSQSCTANVARAPVRPVILSISPSQGPTTGNQTVTITGSNLATTSSVTFGGVAATIVSTSSTRIIVLTPPHAAGPVDVVVTTSSGQASLSGAYTYVVVTIPPAVTGISPTSGPVAGGQTVTITGSGLAGVTSVTFGGTAATIVSVSDTSIVVTTPPHAAGPVAVVVTSATGTASTTYTYLPPQLRILPVVGSGPGAFESFFKTTVQLYNDGASTITGQLVFHPQGVPASSTDPSLPFSVGPGQTQSIPDVVAAIGASGIGSLDITSPDLTSLFVAARIYNDAGAAGTTGMSIDALLPGDALQSGDTGILIEPANVESFRFNIGIRTLDAGASLRLTLLDALGATKVTTTKTYGANYFQQTSAADLLGAPLAANDTLVIVVDAGSAIVYGSTTDNRTQDPTFQLAHSKASQRRFAEAGKVVYPVVGSVAGAFESFFRSAMQLHNAGVSTITGRLVFHPEGASASPSDPSVSFSMAPGQTQSIADVVAATGATGVGSLDVLASDLESLFTTIRIFNDGGEIAGTTGMSTDPLAPADALQAGETGILIGPADTANFRVNIGIRTLDDGASIQFKVVSAIGLITQTTTKSFGTNYFQQTTAVAILGITLVPNDTIVVSINSGSAIVYASIIDNRTQDSTFRLAIGNDVP